MLTTVPRRLALGAGLCAVYIATAKLGLQLDAVSGFATFVWPPTGIALAAMVIFGRKLWPAIAVGAFVVNWMAGAPVAVALAISVGNTLEPVVGALVLERFRFDPAISRVRDVLVLGLGAAMSSTLISASIGASSLWAGGVIDASAFVPTWRAWWIGDALGDLIVASFLLVWYRTRLRVPRGRIIEGLAAVLMMAVTALYVFDVILPRPSGSDVFRTPYLVFPILIWATLRFRELGATAGTLVLWIVAITVTVLGFGPFTAARLSESLLPLQLFMGVVAVAMLFLGAAVAERDRAIRARDEFLAVASHELRTPLAAMGLQITNVRELAKGGALPQDKLLAKLDVLERQGDRMAALVGNLLDVSRIAVDRFEITHELVNVTDVIREVVVRSRDQAAKVGSELLVDLAECPPITSDRLRLEQIVTNLLSNALKFGGGKPIEISSTVMPNKIELRVRDHGVGIADADRGRVFERFERAGSQRPSSGLGLGLWIVREIVVAMGGAIALRSEPGDGAEFTVTLPSSPSQT